MRILGMAALAFAFLALACGDDSSSVNGGSGGGAPGGSGGTGTAGSGGSGGDPGGSGGEAGSGGTVPTEGCARYSANVRTDDGIYDVANVNPPRDPGSDFLDPFFRTRMVRLTGTDQGPSCRTPAYGQSAFNKDATWVMVECGGQAKLIGLDPTTYKLTNRGQTVFAAETGFNPETEDAWFSGKDAQVIFARDESNNRLLRYHIVGHRYSLVRTLNDHVDAGDRIEQLSVSADDSVFAVARVGSTGTVKGYIVWNNTTQTVTSALVDKLGTVRIDRSGRYLFLSLVGTQPSAPGAKVVDLESGMTTDIRGVEPDASPTTFDLGSGIEVGYASFPHSVHLRDLSTPTTATEVLDLEGLARHRDIDIAASGAPWAVVSFWGTENTPYANELVSVATDGSGEVFRLAHHRATSPPVVSLSPDGCLAAFTSEMTAVEEDHVYLLVIPAR